MQGEQVNMLLSFAGSFSVVLQVASTASITAQLSVTPPLAVLQLVEAPLGGWATSWAQGCVKARVAMYARGPCTGFL